MSLLIVNNAKDESTDEKTPVHALVDVLIHLGIPYEIVSSIEDLRHLRRKICGIILTGTTVYIGGDRVQEVMALNSGAMLMHPKVPVLGICWGFQILCQMHGGILGTLTKRNEGLHETRFDMTGDRRFLRGLGERQICSYSHNNYVKELPIGWHTLATSVALAAGEKIIVATKHPSKPYYGVLFHPEGVQSTYQIIQNFWTICAGSRCLPRY